MITPAYGTTIGITTSGPVDIEINAGANVGQSTVTAMTDCRFGYTLSIAASVGDTKLYRDGNSANLDYTAPSSGTMSALAAIVDANGVPNTTWGYSMKDKTVAGEFVGLTSTMTDILTTNATSANNGDNIPIYFGASAVFMVPPGTYKMANNGAVVYYLTTNQVHCEVFEINYDGNGADADFDTSLLHKSVMRDDNLVLYASNYKRAGYGFAGWSTAQIDPDAVDASEQIANAKIYGPEETVAIGDEILAAADEYDKITLYAVWMKSEGDFQSFDRCDAMEVGEVTALTDTRDGDTYAIAKLKDGKCWMIENLRLGEDTPMNLTASDSNLTENFTLLASTLDFDPDNYTTAWLNIENKKSSQAVAETLNGKIYSYGTYYSWPAAVASTTLHPSVSLETSICQNGWKLPTGGVGGEYSALDVSLGGTGSSQSTAESSGRWRAYPNNFVFSGGRGGGPANRGTYGYYATAMVANSGYAYYFYLLGTSINPETSSENTKNYVTTARCIAN